MEPHSWVDVSDGVEEQREWKCENCGRRVQSTTEMVAADREGCETEGEDEDEVDGNGDGEDRDGNESP